MIQNERERDSPFYMENLLINQQHMEGVCLHVTLATCKASENESLQVKDTGQYLPTYHEHYKSLRA